MCSAKSSLRLLPRLLRIFCRIHWHQSAEPCPFALRVSCCSGSDVGADSCVVKHVCWQGDDPLQQIVLQHIASISLSPDPAPPVKRAVQNDTESAAAVLSRTHLADRCIRNGKEPSLTLGSLAKSPSKPIALCSASISFLIFFNSAKGWVGEHVVVLLFR